MPLPITAAVAIAIDLLTAITALSAQLKLVNDDIQKARAENRDLTDAEVDRHQSAATAARATTDALIASKGG